ncbi:MAG TPA: DUF6541 family protein [Microbacterium sp.]|nr:DUF6541 family protein [Microbacterium sp.]
MQWLAFTWAAVATALLLIVIGVPLARIIGLRGFAVIAAAPAFAVTVVAGAAVVAPWLGVSWSVLPVIVVAIVLGVLLALVRRATRRFEPRGAPRRRFDGWLLTAFVVAAALLAFRFVEIIYGPDNISQTFDNVFHLNAVRFALDTGNASSLWLGHMSNPSGGLPFYPAAWHALVSLVVQLTGVTIPVGVNAVTLVVSAVIWPLGVLLLTRTLFGRSRILSISAALLAASLPLFPTLPMNYGVLYPYQLGLALLPVALAATLRALGLARGVSAPSRWWWAVAVLGAMPGLALSHPGAFVAWVALTFPMAIVFIVVQWRATASRNRRLLIAGLTSLYLVIGLILVIVLRPPAEARGWPIQMNLWEAFVDLITVSAWYQVPAVIAALAIVAGIVWACVSRTVPATVAIGMYAVAALLFIVVAALPLLYVRDALTGMWYNNLPRLAALLPIVMVPIGAYGVACTWAKIASTKRMRDITDHGPRWVLPSVGVAIAALAAVGMQTGPASPVPMAVQWASASYYLGPDSPLISVDEMTLIDRIDDHVPEEAVIAGSPYTGASLAYALADRPVLMPHLLMEITEDLMTVNDGLASATAGDQVCAALDRLGVGFVLDFGGVQIIDSPTEMPGLAGLEDSGAVRLVDQEGTARLYEVVACNR